MKVGVVLPHFRGLPDAAIEVAHAAEELGVHGVFCYDHLWPMGQPDRPAIAPFPLLAAIAATTEQVAVGTLVARIGLVPVDVLASQFRALESLAPGRVVAGLGTGDRHSAEENAAYGLDWEPASARRAALEECARELVAAGVPVWIGGGAPATLSVAQRVGSAVNLWDAAPAVIAAQAQETQVTWGGPAPRGRDDVDSRERLADLLADLAAAGATWAVVGYPVDLPLLADLAAAVGS